ncbi:MAG: hypothetical protein ABL974_03695 [Prosthecobacter sp.]
MNALEALVLSNLQAAHLLEECLRQEKGAHQAGVDLADKEALNDDEAADTSSDRYGHEVTMPEP